MKIKLLLTALVLTTTHVFFAQEINKNIIEEKPVVVKDSVKSIDLTQRASVGDLLTTSVAAEAVLAKQKAEEKANKEAEKRIKEELKAKNEEVERQ
ncbi:hypothetical protein, partial [Flavobacterium sp.]|uniref:hypothetical protein n=1 Tax=Flavobacterium sp. TaxID=239 RepID=UPI0038FCBF1B